jgi:hypothetical protein
MAEYVIDKSTWPCIWEQIINKHEGPQSFAFSNGPNFSAGMLEEMIDQVTRVKDKYSHGEWANDENARRLVELVSEHLAGLIAELDEVKSGRRQISTTDIFLPSERKSLS